MAYFLFGVLVGLAIGAAIGIVVALTRKGAEAVNNLKV